MTAHPNDSDLDRLKGERDHLRLKLILAHDRGRRDANGIERLQRSLEQVEKSIAAVVGLSGTDSASSN